MEDDHSKITINSGVLAKVGHIESNSCTGLYCLGKINLKILNPDTPLMQMELVLRSKTKSYLTHVLLLQIVSRESQPKNQ